MVLIITPLWAKKINPILKCLGKEEAKIHQLKMGGPLYRLNRVLIENIVRTNDITLKKKYLKSICQDQSFSPSVAFLKLMIEKQEEIFFFQNKKDPFHQFKRVNIQEFLAQTPIIFMNYLSWIQGTTPLPQCLETEVPELSALMIRYKHLEDTVEMNSFLQQEKKKISKVFHALKRIDDIHLKCEMRAKQRKANSKKQSL